MRDTHVRYLAIGRTHPALNIVAYSEADSIDHSREHLFRRPTSRIRVSVLIDLAYLAIIPIRYRFDVLTC